MVLNTLDDNITFWSPYYTALENALAGDAIVSGLSISKGTGDWDIDVTSGALIESWTETSISSGTVTITDSSGLGSGESRITLIHADTGDALASTDGSAAADPDAPDLPAGEVLLGFVVVSDTDSTVADSEIVDLGAIAPAARSNSIQIWSGSIANIPTGWVLCDGNNSTPNLQDKFVIGAGNTHAVDDTGGEGTHQLTTSELASHSHDLAANTAGGNIELSSDSGDGTDHRTQNAGGDSAHENKPPFHALAFIMKT